MDVKSRQLLNAGSKFKFACYLNEGSKPVSFDWSRNGQRLAKSDKYKIDTFADESILTIPRLESTDSGNYSCVARNDFGHDSQFTALLVKGLISVSDPYRYVAHWFPEPIRLQFPHAHSLVYSFSRILVESRLNPG